MVRTAARPEADATLPAGRLDPVVRAEREGTPLVVDEGRLTWVWTGDEPPGLVGDWGDWTLERTLPRQRHAAGWSGSLEVEPDASLESSLVAGGGRVADPPARTPARRGGHGPPHGAWTPTGPGDARRRTRARGADVPPGEVTEHRLEHFDRAIVPVRTANVPATDRPS